MPLKSPKSTHSGVGSVQGSGSEDQVPSGTKAAKIKEIVSFLRKTREWAKTHSTLVVTILLFPIMATRGALPELVLPYVSLRYGWPLRRVRNAIKSVYS